MTVRAAIAGIILVTLFSSCATTRYEEYGPPPGPMEEMEETGQSVQGMEPVNRAVEALPTLSELSELESAVRGHLDQLESADDTLMARITALSDQVQELRTRLDAYESQPMALSPQPKPKPTTALPAPAPNVNVLYERALQAFDAQKYGAAKGHFEMILATDAKGVLSDNAQYWLGECEYAVEDYTGALEAFKRVFQYQTTEKDDDAQIKLGYCYLKLGDAESALIEFKRLTVDYPQSEYLTRAEEQIRRIRAARASKP